MKVVGDPVLLFWDKATTWRKLKLLRTIDSIKSPTGMKCVDEIKKLRSNSGGFARMPGEPPSVTPTAEAITYLSSRTDSAAIRDGVDFLWRLQMQNGSWHENPEMPKDKVPFWSSVEKGVPILTADCVESLAVTGHGKDERLLKAVAWLQKMQSSSGMWLSLEDAEPTDTEPDSTQRAMSALVAFGVSRNSPVIRRASKALEEFIQKEASEWAKTHPPAWPWVAALDGLVAAGYVQSDTPVQYALERILALQRGDGSWPNGYEVRVVPTLISLGVISREHVLKTIATKDRES